MAREERRTPRQIFLRLLCLVYGVLMLWLLFGQRLGTGIYGQQADSLNLIPFKTLRMYASMAKNSADLYLIHHAVVNLAGNVVMFIPLGFYFPYLGKGLRAFWKTMLAGFFLIVAVEAIQYFTLLGACDIDDLILNLAGVLIGYIIWKNHRQ